jgi:hypothetical protein
LRDPREAIEGVYPQKVIDRNDGVYYLIILAVLQQLSYAYKCWFNASSFIEFAIQISEVSSGPPNLILDTECRTWGVGSPEWEEEMGELEEVGGGPVRKGKAIM